jgi:hypothetical protein
MIDINMKTLLEGLRQALSTISPREREIILHRLSGKTLRQAGAELENAVGPERARQLEYRGTRKLLHPSRHKYIRAAIREDLQQEAKKQEKEVKHVALSKNMPKHIRKRLKKRKDGRWEIKRSDLPRFADGTDHLPNPAEIDGKSMTWVGIGWTENGPATGKEPLVIVEDNDG